MGTRKEASLVKAVLAWASTEGVDDDPEWKAWDAIWHDAEPEDRRGALVTLALAVRRTQAATS
jgi:hypothetical protein